MSTVTLTEFGFIFQYKDYQSVLINKDDIVNIVADLEKMLLFTKGQNICWQCLLDTVNKIVCGESYFVDNSTKKSIFIKDLCTYIIRKSGEIYSYREIGKIRGASHATAIQSVRKIEGILMMPKDQFYQKTVYICKLYKIN